MSATQLALHSITSLDFWATLPGGPVLVWGQCLAAVRGIPGSLMTGSIAESPVSSLQYLLPYQALWDINPLNLSPKGTSSIPAHTTLLQAISLLLFS